MNFLIMDIPVRPFSLNHSKRPVRLPSGQMRMVSTGKAKDQKRELELLLLKYNLELKQMGQAFKPRDHFWRIKYMWMYEQKEYWNSKGEINQNTIDLDNGVKGFQDSLFAVIGMNDAGTADIRVLKLPGHVTKCVVHLSYHPWEDLI